MQNSLYQAEAHAAGSRLQLTKGGGSLCTVPVRPESLPRKFMVVGYFAESKGVVGWSYQTSAGLQNRGTRSGS